MYIIIVFSLQFSAGIFSKIDNWKAYRNSVGLGAVRHKLVNYLNIYLRPSSYVEYNSDKFNLNWNDFICKTTIIEIRFRLIKFNRLE